MKTTTETNFQTTVAARIAGEDINQGDYVTVLNEIVELPSFLWSCSGVALPADGRLRLKAVMDEKPVAAESIRDGADLVLFSGDKLGKLVIQV